MIAKRLVMGESVECFPIYRERYEAIWDVYPRSLRPMLLRLGRKLFLSVGFFTEVLKVEFHLGRDVTSTASGKVLHDFVAIDVVRPFRFLSIREFLDAFFEVELVPSLSEEMRKVAIREPEEVDSFSTLRFTQIS